MGKSPYDQGFRVGDTVSFSSLGRELRGQIVRFSKENGIWKVVVDCNGTSYYLKVSSIRLVRRK